MGRALELAAKAFAFAGGAVMVAMLCMSVASITGRTFLGGPVQCDFELVQLGCAVGIAAFLPWCQWRRGNIIVDFFTLRASARTRDRLDRFGCLLLAAMCALLAWRTLLGGLSAREYGSVTMLVVQGEEWT